MVENNGFNFQSASTYILAMTVTKTGYELLKYGHWDKLLRSLDKQPIRTTRGFPTIIGFLTLTKTWSGELAS